MKALLDEMLPRRLSTRLRNLEADVASFPNEWKGLKNGHLLDRLEKHGFGCLITSDSNLVFQQSFEGRRLALMVLPVSRYDLLEPIAEPIANALDKLQPNEVVWLTATGETRLSGHLKRH